jgi:hypothetical protein
MTRASWLASVCIASLTATSSPAAAHLYDREPPRFETALELAMVVLDSETAFSELAPRTLFGLVAGVYVVPSLRLGAAFRATLSDPESEHYEVLADLTWSHVAEPRLPDPPALRVAAALEVGWRSTELESSEIIALDRGVIVSLGVSLGMVVFEDLALSLQVAGVAGTSSNPDFTPWAPKLRIGLSVSTLL